MIKAYSVRAILRATAVDVALEDRILMVLQFFLLVVHETTTLPVNVVPLHASASLRVWIAWTYAAATPELIEVRPWDVRAMPHQIRVVELHRGRRLIVDVVDDANWWSIGLVLRGIRSDLCFKDCLQIAGAPGFGRQRVDAILKVGRNIFGRLCDWREFPCNASPVLSPRQRLKAGILEGS